MTNTLILEDGSGNPYVIGANTYVTVAAFQDYCTARGYVIVADPSVLLVQAMDYIDSLMYVGLKLNRFQPLQWPRYGVVVDSWYVPINIIPPELPKAQCECAIAIDQGNSPLQLYPRQVTSERVGDLQVTYAIGTSSLPVVRTINQALYKILAGGAPNGNNIRMGRG